MRENNRKNLLKFSIFFLFALFSGYLASADEAPQRLSGGETLTVVIDASNMRDESVQRDIRYYLPEGVSPQHLVDNSGFRIKLDPETDSYYLTKSVFFEAGETKVFSVDVEDVWKISEELVSAYMDNAGSFYEGLKGTEEEALAHQLYSSIREEGTKIIDSQTGSRSITDHIRIGEENKKRLDSLQGDLKRLQELYGRGYRKEPEKEYESTPVNNLLFLINTFVLVFTVVFFGTWYKKMNKKNEENK